MDDGGAWLTVGWRDNRYSAASSRGYHGGGGGGGEARHGKRKRKKEKEKGDLRV